MSKIDKTQDNTEEISHEITLFAEPVMHIGKFEVTNSILTSFVTVLVVVLLAFILKRNLKKIPGRFQGMFESILEGALSLADQVTGNRKITEKIFPLVFGIFVFVLINNWLGLLPLSGLGFIEVHDGVKSFVPLFRSGTADINTTIALAVISVVGSNLFGILTIGAWKSFNKYVNLKTLGEIPKKIKKEPMIIMIAPINFFVGILELIGEFAKVASLSFRLFGNVFAGEVLLAAMATIFAYILPLPFIFLEVFVGLIQALIFSMLTLVYFTIAATDHSEQH